MLFVVVGIIGAAASGSAAAPPPPLPITCPLPCADGTKATGPYAIALGQNSTASGPASVAMGDGCVASDKSGVALGHMTTAAGPYSTAMGYKTTASHSGTSFGYFTAANGLYSAAFGNYVGTTESEAMVVSGNVHARNVHLFAEDRLTANVTAVRDRAAMLAELRELELTEWSPSPELCAHRGISAQRCAAPEQRTVGLLASRMEAAMPAAVTTLATSLHLTDGRTEGIKRDVEDVRSVDVAALLTRLVGSVQALDAQVQAQSAEIAELRQTVAHLQGQE